MKKLKLMKKKNMFKKLNNKYLLYLKILYSQIKNQIQKTMKFIIFFFNILFMNFTYCVNENTANASSNTSEESLDLSQAGAPLVRPRHGGPGRLTDEDRNLFSRGGSGSTDPNQPNQTNLISSSNPPSIQGPGPLDDHPDQPGSGPSSALSSQQSGPTGESSGQPSEQTAPTGQTASSDEALSRPDISSSSSNSLNQPGNLRNQSNIGYQEEGNANGLVADDLQFLDEENISSISDLLGLLLSTINESADGIFLDDYGVLFLEIVSRLQNTLF